MQRLIILLFVIAVPIVTLSQMNSKDSALAQSLEKFYIIAEKQANKIWPDMKPTPVMLYRINGPVLLYNHPKPGKNFNKRKANLHIGKHKEIMVYGNYCSDFKGIPTAIVNYDLPDVESPEKLFAIVFHEMHHGYQKNYCPKYSFSPVDPLITYPENAINDALKIYEQRLLYKMVNETRYDKFLSLFNTFYSCRLKREAIIGPYLKWEEKTESMEGPAFYTEYRMYEFLINDTVESKKYLEKHFLKLLTETHFGRTALRQRCLPTGMALCLILDKWEDNWKKPYYQSGRSLVEFAINKFNPEIKKVHIPAHLLKESKVKIAQTQKQRAKIYGKFKDQAGIKIVLNINNATIGGFDPMNAIGISDSLILHKTIFEAHSNKGHKIQFNNYPVTTQIKETIWKTKKITFFIDQNENILKGNKISFENEHIKIHWPYSSLKKEKNHVEFWLL
ncbi:hypothetical protein [Salinivirga cyanobacteriivorans]